MTDSDSDELERIRERKRQELLEAEASEGDTTVESLDEPVYVDGPGEFDRLLGDHEVVLADFYADWCGPCQMLDPIVKSVAASTPATVAKADTDQHAGLAQEHGVRGLPTLVLFVDGQSAERVVGVQDEATLTNLVEMHAN
jgi:thioredoxin 1